MRQRWVHLHLILRVYLTLLDPGVVVVVREHRKVGEGGQKGDSSMLIFSLSAALENCQNE